MRISPRTLFATSALATMLAGLPAYAADTDGGNSADGGESTDGGNGTDGGCVEVECPPPSKGTASTGETPAGEQASAGEKNLVTTAGTPAGQKSDLAGKTPLLGDCRTLYNGHGECMTAEKAQQQKLTASTAGYCWGPTNVVCYDATSVHSGPAFVEAEGTPASAAPAKKTIASSRLTAAQVRAVDTVVAECEDDFATVDALLVDRKAKKAAWKTAEKAAHDYAATINGETNAAAEKQEEQEKKTRELGVLQTNAAVALSAYQTAKTAHIAVKERVIALGCRFDERKEAIVGGLEDSVRNLGYRLTTESNERENADGSQDHRLTNLEAAVASPVATVYLGPSAIFRHDAPLYGLASKTEFTLGENFQLGFSAAGYGKHVNTAPTTEVAGTSPDGAAQLRVTSKDQGDILSLAAGPSATAYASDNVGVGFGVNAVWQHDVVETERRSAIYEGGRAIPGSESMPQRQSSGSTNWLLAPALGVDVRVEDFHVAVTGHAYIGRGDEGRFLDPGVSVMVGYGVGTRPVATKGTQ